MLGNEQVSPAVNIFLLRAAPRCNMDAAAASGLSRLSCSANRGLTAGGIVGSTVCMRPYGLTLVASCSEQL